MSVKVQHNIKGLKEYIANSPYIELINQPDICALFNCPYYVGLFRLEYARRLIAYLYTNTTTAATVSRDTNIPHKFICQMKMRLQKAGQLQVVGFGRCPATGSNNVQYLSCNPKVWLDPSSFIPTKQISLFV